MSSVQEHNEMELARLEIGDAVEFKLAACSHWVLYIGDGLVIHLTGESIAECCNFSLVTNSGLKSRVRLDGFLDVANDAKAIKNNYNDSKFRVRPIDKIIATCWSMEGKVNANFEWKSCEDFVNCCKYGKKTSRQITPIHNKMELAGLERGDVVEFTRGIYSHWAIFIGDGLVIHLTRDNSAFVCNCSGVGICGQTSKKALVRVDGFFVVANDDKAIKNNYDDSKFRVRPVEVIIAYAMSMGSQEGKWYNCKQFVHFCRYGVDESEQHITQAHFKKGDAIEFNRGFYSHWALYIGDGLVIHVTLDSSSGGQKSKKACVKIEPILDVSGVSEHRVNNYYHGVLWVRPVDEIIAAALSMMGEIDYNVFTNNDKHFVNYCRYGAKKINKHITQADLKKGDAIEFKRVLYSHWALYIGDGLVIHVTLDSSSGDQKSKKACVKIEPILHVHSVFGTRVNNYYDDSLRVRPVDKIIATALSMMGEIDYNVLTNNCEHFVNYCRYGENWSRQVVEAAILGVCATTAIGAIHSHP